MGDNNSSKPVILSIYDYDNLLTDIDDTKLPPKQIQTSTNTNYDIGKNSTLLPNFKIIDTIPEMSNNLIVFPSLMKMKNEPTICLNMIVKNESRIIKRLLDSVANIIDTYCICDTGSTDNTKEIITEFFNEHNIKGKIVEEPFKDFCYNRNFAMTEAIGMSDYLLLLDADMILQIGNNFNKESLVNIDTANIFQGTEDFYYQNLRICRNEGKCKYIGVTHEYIDVPNNYINRTEILRDKLFILDIWKKELNITYNEIAYIGDDINDIEILEKVGYSGCPNDAIINCQQVVNYICKKNHKK